MNQTKAFAILKTGLTPYVRRTLKDSYGESWTTTSVDELSSRDLAVMVDNNPLQALMTFWSPVFSKNPSLNLDHIRHLNAIQTQELDTQKLSVTIDMMSKLLVDVGAFTQVAQLRLSSTYDNARHDSSSFGSSILSPEGLAIMGGVATAGFLVYKGITALMNNTKIDDDTSCPDPEEVSQDSCSAVEAKAEADAEAAENPFVCPITLQIMKDPVITPQGLCFERQAILDWIEKKHTCPITHEPLDADRLITCYTLKNAITDYERMQMLASSSSISLSSSHGGVVAPNPAPPPKKKLPMKIDVAHAIADRVKVWGTSKICSVDRCPDYPERKKFIVFPGSTNWVVDRCTGYICIENRGDHDIKLVSRQRGPSLFDPFNEGARIAGTYTLRAHTRQGFDFKGSYCIEVSNTEDPLDMLVYDYAPTGGGKGNWLKMR